MVSAGDSGLNFVGCGKYSYGRYPGYDVYSRSHFTFFGFFPISAITFFLTYYWRFYKTRGKDAWREGLFLTVAIELIILGIASGAFFAKGTILYWTVPMVLSIPFGLYVVMTLFRVFPVLSQVSD